MTRTLLPIALLLLLLPPPSSALERTLARAADRPGPSDDWGTGGICSVSYFNDCNGWVWIWEDWQGTDVIGMVFEPQCDEGSYQTLVSTQLYAWSGAGSYPYGNTGTITLHAEDESGCPTTVLAVQSFLPATGLNVTNWGVPVSGPVVVRFINPADKDPMVELATWATDHPSAGPTGPPGCGTCYPTGRVGHSFYYGPEDSPLCPPLPLEDGGCDAEWMHWSATFSSPVSVRASGWASIKALYR
jgi:hypothetical protein